MIRVDSMDEMDESATGPLYWSSWLVELVDKNRFGCGYAALGQIYAPPL